MPPRPQHSTQNMVDAFMAHQGNCSAAARSLGLSASTLQKHLSEKTDLLNKPTMGGRSRPEDITVLTLPPKGKINCFLLTSAQNNTKVHTETWSSLLGYLAWLQSQRKVHRADLMVSKFTYNKSAYGRKSVKPGGQPTKEDLAALWFDPAIEEYCQTDDKQTDVQLAPSLMWVNRANILPTAEAPLSGFEAHYGSLSAVYPHAKIALESVANSAADHPKLMYTTGTVTRLNYVQKKAGLKAEHHHCYGAAIVEVDSEGNHWVRHLNADSQGRMFDLDRIITSDGKVSTGNGVHCITWGDVHAAQLDPVVEEAAWGANGMLDELLPAEQHVHDLYDMHAANHHNTNSFHRRYRLFVNEQHRVLDELRLTAEFVRKAHRDGVKMVIVRSNHDDALERWLDAADYRDDLENAEIYLEAQLEWVKQVRKGNDNWMMLEWALRRFEIPEDVTFLGRDESYLICRSIECGNHGDDGPNGSRGSLNSFHKMGRKQNLGHLHTARIRDGVYFTGLCATPDYRRGPNSHSVSHIVTYPNGKRTIVTMLNGKWRA